MRVVKQGKQEDGGQAIRNLFAPSALTAIAMTPADKTHFWRQISVKAKAKRLELSATKSLDPITPPWECLAIYLPNTRTWCTDGVARRKQDGSQEGKKKFGRRRNSVGDQHMLFFTGSILAPLAHGSRPESPGLGRSLSA